MRAQQGIDWPALADLVCGILESVNAEHEQFQVEAWRRGTTLEQLTAAAIVEALAERVEGSPPPGLN